MGFLLSFIKIKDYPQHRQVCLTMPPCLSNNAFANIFAEGAYHRIDLEIDKTHDDYLKHKKMNF